MFTRVAVVLRGFVRDLHVSLNPSERADVTVGLTVGVRVCVCGCVRVCVWLCACACVLLGDEREELYKSLSHEVLCKNGCQMILRNSTCDKGILGDKVSFPHTLTHLGEQNTYRHTHLLTCISNRQHPSGFSRDLEVL